jgi:hypothetical protein
MSAREFPGEPSNWVRWESPAFRCISSNGMRYVDRKYSDVHLVPSRSTKRSLESVGNSATPKESHSRWSHRPSEKPEEVLYARITSAVLVRSDLVCGRRRKETAPVVAGRSITGPSSGSHTVTSAHWREKTSIARSQPSHAARFTRAAQAVGAMEHPFRNSSHRSHGNSHQRIWRWVIVPL